MSSISLFFIPVALLILLITTTSTSAQTAMPEEVPYPVKVVPSDQIPPGYVNLPGDPGGNRLILEDAKVPGILFGLLSLRLPPGYSLVIPGNAGEYGYTTNYFTHPPELIVIEINKVPAGFRPISPAPAGQVNILRGPSLGGKGFINAPAPPGFTLAFPLIPPNGLKMESEFLKPYVPPPLQIIQKYEQVPRGMQVIPDALPGQDNVLVDSANPGRRVIILNPPPTMRLLAPVPGTSSVTVQIIPNPGGMDVLDKKKIPPPGIQILPEPELGEELVITDSSSGVKMALLRPPPGIVYAMLEQLPPGMEWNLENEGEVAQYQQQVVGVDNSGFQNSLDYSNVNEVSNNNDYGNQPIGNAAYDSPSDYGSVSDERLLEIIALDDKLTEKKKSSSSKIGGKNGQKLGIFLLILHAIIIQVNQ